MLATVTCANMKLFQDNVNDIPIQRQINNRAIASFDSYTGITSKSNVYLCFCCPPVLIFVLFRHAGTSTLSHVVRAYCFTVLNTSGYNVPAEMFHEVLVR